MEEARSTLTRRQMLRLAGGAAAGMLLAPRAAPVSARPVDRHLPFPRRLRLARPQRGVVEATLVAAPATVRVHDRLARLWTYNGSLPGPLLRLREGEHVRLRLTNRLHEETNLHLHGLRVSPAVDDPFLSISPGESVLYEFDVPQGSRGLHWYHPHVHGRVAQQLFAGLAGPILVDAADEPPRPRDVADRVVVLKDLELVDGAPAPHAFADWRRGKEGRLLLVNGALAPALVATDRLLRLRFLNASNARYYRLALEEHAFRLVASDGHALGQPLVVDELLLAPGERADALVALEREGRFALLDLPYDRGAGMMMGGPGGAAGPEPVRLMTIVRPPGIAARAVPPPYAAAEDLRQRPADAVRRLVLAEGMMMGGGFTINGRTFDPGRVELGARLGTVEVWEIENRGRMDHPFHLHTYPFQVLSRNGAPESAVLWKDVVNVRPGEVVRVAVALRDFAGRTVFHCHIVEHEDRGMMGTLEVTPA
ncbi:MAG: multicopper oxidase family protein [Thermodesulfobacteriota bacterium]